MNIQVYPHRIILNKTNEVNSGEYNVNECTFEFSQEYEGLTKVAVFSLCDGTTKNVTILNNQCIIPVECLQETGQVQIGVYGYATQDNELVLRYSPTPQNFVVRLGSYKEGTQPVAPTPTDWEILVEQVSDIAEDVSNIHEDITGINGEISGINIDIRDLQDTKANISDLAEVAFTGEFSDLKNIPSYATTQQLNQEIQDRQDADVNLQSQIDAISVSSDVVDVVGTYQELLDYDTTHLKDNDIVKVLQDSTHSDALSYYRWDKETSTWSYVGSEGPFYTKSETDALLNYKQDVIDIDNMLSSDLVDDTNSTNKFVTQADITNWNNKEDKSNKVTEINSSSTDTQYPSAKCVYDSQEEQNEQIAELEMLYNAFPTVSDEDTTIQLDNTAKVKFREIDLKGNTSQVVIPEEQGTSVSNTSIYVSDVDTDKEHTIEMSGNTYQETTTGKNLCEPFVFETSTTRNGITVSYDAQTQTYTFNGTCDSDNTTFKFSNNSINFTANTSKMIVYWVNGSVTNYCTIRLYNNNYNGPSQDITSLSSTTPYLSKTYSSTITSNNSNSTIRFNNGSVATNFKIKVMITDSDNTDFEKFTFGASPNPSYPQNIEAVTGENNITICGKNLFDKSKAVLGKRLDPTGYYYNDADYYTSPYIRVTPNIKYIKNSPSQDAYHRYCFYTKDKVFINQSAYNVYTIPSNCWYVRFCGLQSELDTTQFEQGDTSTTYEEYQGATYPINLGNIELCKIDTYQDRIYKSNDKWYLEKNIGKETDDGSSDEIWYKMNREINGCYAYRHNGSYSEILLCDKLTNYTAGQLFNGIGEGIGFSSTGNYLAVYIKAERVNSYDVASLKQFLTTNPITYYYQLATPTTTEITDTTLVNQLNALYNATIYPITNINTDTSNLLPYIDLHYNFVTPSPSPSRPSVVNVVKGNNTITISNSDNTESQNYPINLGDMELCKIGTYQDYIYESNGNWFKKGNIGKVTLNGSETYSSFSNNRYRTQILTSGIDGYSMAICICNTFIGSSQSDFASADLENRLAVNSSYIWIRVNSTTTENELKTLLQQNNAIIYYVLETPTDTQITDTTLINQLNNLEKAYSYDTQTNISQTNTDKPFIIYAEAIRSLKDVFE